MPKVEYVLSALSKIEQTVVRVIDNSEAITIPIKSFPLGEDLGEAPKQL